MQWYMAVQTKVSPSGYKEVSAWKDSYHIETAMAAAGNYGAKKGRNGTKYIATVHENDVTGRIIATISEGKLTYSEWYIEDTKVSATVDGVSYSISLND